MRRLKRLKLSRPSGIGFLLLFLNLSPAAAAVGYQLWLSCLRPCRQYSMSVSTLVVKNALSVLSSLRQTLKGVCHSSQHDTHWQWRTNSQLDLFFLFLQAKKFIELLKKYYLPRYRIFSIILTRIILHICLNFANYFRRLRGIYPLHLWWINDQKFLFNTDIHARSREKQTAFHSSSFCGYTSLCWNMLSSI